MINNILLGILLLLSMAAINILLLIALQHHANRRTDEIFWIAIAAVVMFIATHFRIDYAMRKIREVKESCENK